MRPTLSELQETREFWNASPCGRQGTLEERKVQRYRMEPWLPDKIREIATANANVVELGCGQGTDAMVLCSWLPSGGSYLGIDHSDASVEIARDTAMAEQSRLRVAPTFQVGDAGAIDLDSDSVDCIYSMGVLHHMEDERRAFREIHRVLKPGGSAYLWLYRSWTPKVAVAKALRRVQEGVDRIFGSDRAFYNMLYGCHMEGSLGTMVMECFGVPHLKSYTRSEVLRLTSDLEVTRLAPVGYSFPWLHRRNDGQGFLGYFWDIELRKAWRQPPSAP